jgi:diguanylate cyclase (GGDEF)-like protein/PAS domain S-box-containing protein
MDIYGKRLGTARQAMASWHAGGSISRSIMLSWLALFMLMVIGVGSIALAALYSALRQNAANELDADGRLLHQQLDTELDNIVRELSALAAHPVVLHGVGDPTVRSRSVAPLLNTQARPHLLSIIVYDISGTPDMGTAAASAEIRRVVESGKALASVLADADGRRMLYLSYPLRPDPAGPARGVLLGKVALDDLFDQAAQLLAPATSVRELTVAGATGDGAQAQTGYLQLRWKAGLKPPLDTLDLRVRIGRQESEVLTPLRRAATLYAVFALLALACTVFFARRSVRRLVSPLSSLRRTASEIAASGSLDLHAKASGQHEFASLAHAFNQMMERMRHTQSQLQARASEFKALADNAPDLVARFDPQLRCIYVNRRLHACFGLAPERVLGQGPEVLGLGEDAREIMRRLLKTGGEAVHEYSSGARYFEVRIVAEHDNGGAIVSLLGFLRDVSARRSVEDSLHLARRAIEASETPIIVTGIAEDDYAIRYVNPAFERVTGYASDEACGRNCRFLQGEDREQPPLDELRKALSEQREARVELRNYRKDGSRFWSELFISPVRDEQGQVTHFVGELIDITMQHEQQEQLHHQATHDPLTGLPNRNLLTDRLMQAISYAQRYQRMIAVAFLDLDKFKHINDSMGHEAGDQLLKIVGERLAGCVRDSDTVARLGGDEFVLVLYDQANEDITYHAMQRVLGSISQPVMINGREMSITCSIGFAVYPQDGEDAETLIRNADTAMYRAKELGRDNFQFYTEDLHTRINERLGMEAGLRRALQQHEFILHYQPRVDLGSGKVNGMEALIRWNHPQLGLVEPLRFVPLAEELGLIHQIGEWVMRDACTQQKAWQRQGAADLPVAVNISGAQFLQKDFTQKLAAVLRDTGVDPSRIELEITESLSMQDPQVTIAVLRELKQMGVRLAIDDFGTGYSNLSYLKQFPVDIIKLDRSFVRDIVRNPEDLAISDAVISMAHSLHLRVIAEGVESATQLALLADRACDDMQGFYFSMALPVDDCTAMLLENRALPADKLGRRQADRTLLLIDDEPHVLTALERILRRIGCRILTASSALDAFDLMATHEVGVILCDQRMPEMTGVEFFARIRHMYPATVRMILSGYADVAAVTDAINVGAVYKFLNKPWDANELGSIVDDAFDKYEADLQHSQRWHERRALTG